jgi:AAA15 family ATPase/GTPase
MVASDAANGHEEVDKNNVFMVKSDLNLLKSAAIYGANASGKSNLIRAMAFMRYFVIKSAQTQVDDPINTEEFKLSTETANKPSFFEISLYLRGKIYRYGFEVTKKEVIAEWLYCIPRSKEAKIFTRNKNNIEITSKTIEAAESYKKLTKENTLFLSVAAQFNDALSREIILWFRHLNMINSVHVDFLRGQSVDHFHESDDKFKNRVVQLIKKLDTWINDISLEKQKLPLTEIPLPDKLKSLLDSQDNLESIEVKTSHYKYDQDNQVVGTEFLDMYEHESEGTKKLFVLAAPILDTLINSQILIVDELDARLHPLITKAIIKLFHSPDNKKAQLIFATHDSTLLTSEFFRHDQIWFAEKNSHESTDLYSLIEYDIDQNTNFGKDYLRGKYGAIPFIGNLNNIGDKYND